MPDLIKVGKVSLIPSYTLTHWHSIKADLIQEGTQHELALAASISITLWEPQTLSIRGAANYHDGVLGVERGWTHYTLQADTTFQWHGLYIKPGLNYQWPEEPTLNPEDEFWLSLSITKVF